ncbi:MAG: hypothetical protein L3K26_18835, partial [Candidatus Hydrogenedentes bacterium]|nr:hypothetical protein [Candidatus Hydrogenedentota bacterium]
FSKYYLIQAEHVALDGIGVGSDHVDFDAIVTTGQFNVAEIKSEYRYAIFYRLVQIDILCDKPVVDANGYDAIVNGLGQDHADMVGARFRNVQFCAGGRAGGGIRPTISRNRLSTVTTSAPCATGRNPKHINETTTTLVIMIEPSS